ncbi:choice-of-anchor L domain-containing protein [Polaribacter sp. 20A6]|uniref:choice-of-anchor L domain-containing protein n=1 Tax=Polaribacter sp. 20A6 TaxID=2687289 RepID=UPI0013FE291E|nr:choice-of-anchor L domain-containing protein [Polaribacter sp. 20A6]
MKHLKPKTTNLNRFFKSIIFVASLLLTSSIFSQTVTVDDTKTAEQLANQLIDNSCINLSNVGISSSKSVATFNNNGGDFPISEGIIIRTGNAKDTEGPFTNTKLSSETTVKGDSNLQTISNAEGGLKDISDVGFLEFNFTPIGNKFSFNYIFASNEYGEFQCQNWDQFAIILTNTDTGEKNIATITDAKQSVSVKNIRDRNNNGFCTSVNAELFSTYYGKNSDNSTINMLGFTKRLTATATVIPNTKYKIKFVIGDYDNSDFDSAVFIETGTFDDLIDLGEDKTLCAKENYIIDSGFSKTDGFKFEWKKNNISLLGENGTKLTINTPGTYSLTITSLTKSSCVLNDEVIVTAITATKPSDVSICEGDISFLKSTEVQILNGLSAPNYTVNYFKSEGDANNISIISDNYTLTSSSTNTIWARLANKDNTCFDVVSFNVTINSKPLIDERPDIYVCDEYTLPRITNGKYYTSAGGAGDELPVGKRITTESTIFIYNKNATGCSNETSFTIFFAKTYDIELKHCEKFIIPASKLGQFYTEENGPKGTGELLPTGKILKEDTTIYFYSELEGEKCVDKKFDLTIYPLSVADKIDNIITCESYTLPAGTRYSTGYISNPTGTLYEPGQIINSSITLYNYNKNETTGCISGGFLPNKFTITIIKRTDFPNRTECGSYTIPTTTIGKYYKENTFKTEVPAGTEITSSQKIYYYATDDKITTTPNCTGYEISVTINPLPKVDDKDDIISCEDDLPKLPTIENGNYYTKPGGPTVSEQKTLSPGDEISSTQTIYIYNTNGTCPAETAFTVTINPKPIIPDFPNVSECDPFELPVLSFDGRFFTESGGPSGGGKELFPGELLKEKTQTIYIYSEDPDIATCSNEKSFTVTILSSEVDEFDSVIKTCESYPLPRLTKPGNYYKSADKTGPLFAGELIEESQTIYIIVENTRSHPCQNISSFEVQIFKKPNLEDLGVVNDLEQCGSIILPISSNPDITVEYYRNIERTDLINVSDYTITNSGTEDVTNTIYVRAYPTENPDCYTDGRFNTTIYPLLTLDIKEGTICVNNKGEAEKYLIETGLDASAYNIKWYLEDKLISTDSQANWNATETGAGTYKITATRIDPINNNDCDYKPTEVVIEKSTTPEFEINILSNNFSALYTIEVNVIIEYGIGNYTYSLDNGEYQADNIFKGIGRGNHTITVKNNPNFCNDVILEFTALNNPNYFDPNKDEWNITDLKDDPTATIDIFDRFGIFIKTIKPSGPGWKGISSNGNRMPSTDYWYVLKYTDEDGNPAIFRSHFSLIRK